MNLNQIDMSELGFVPKDLCFGDDGRSRLVSGITKMSMAVKSTLGPGGNTVLIESPHHTHGITVTKDGVTVAKSVDLLDPVENLAVRMMKEAADKTATSAGDGTTTAIVLTEALVKSGIESLTEDGINKTVVLREVVSLSDDVIGRLRKRGRRLNRRIMSDVATISANNDKRVGDLVAGVYAEVGKDGIVTVEKSQTIDTYSETTHGFKVGRGFYSSLFINDHKRDECVMEDVMVLVCDAEIHNLLQIENVLKPIIQEGKRLLIIAPCSVNVVNTLAANVMKNNLKVCAIEPPSFGYKKHELMQDIALAVGAKYFSEKTGDDLSLMTYADLGHALKVVVGQKDTVIVNSSIRTDVAAVEERVSQLWDAHKSAVKKHDKDFILSRIASLTGGVGVIYVGGSTDIEQKELFDRVDDAVCAVRSALEEGVLPGGGKALYEEADKILDCDGDSRERLLAKRIVRSALRAPLVQILENVGLYVDKVYDGYTEPGEGYNVKTGEYGDLIKMGVVDPVKVTRSALQNAVSVATTILGTNAIVTMARTYESK
jgi:chaperonin GroEL